MLDSIRIDTETLDAARELARALSGYRTRLLEQEGAWAVEVERDRELNELLLGVLRATDAYLAGEPGATLSLVVADHAYALRSPVAAQSL